MNKIGVISNASFNVKEQFIFKVLENLYNVKFENRSIGNYKELDAVIYLDMDERLKKEIVPSDFHKYFVCKQDSNPSSFQANQIKFSRHKSVPVPFRGRTMHGPIEDQLEGLVALDNEFVIAEAHGQPIWLQSRSNEYLCYRVGAGLPTFSKEKYFFKYLNSRRFMEMVPLIDFVRKVSSHDGWRTPPLRACFMFDDPNLHFQTYGCLHFQKLIDHAKQNSYHVAFATIPLDGWFIDKRAAQLFREEGAYLSLLMHGNNHLRNEFARDWSEMERITQLSQALRRIQRIEKKAGVKISRVMTSPHGATSEDILKDMAKLGFESACISPGSLRLGNPDEDKVKMVGLNIVDLFGGFPVIGRFRLDSSNENEILLSAFLNKAIVPVGHHYDLAKGFDLLEKFASIINSLGNVQWGDMTMISRPNYLLFPKAELLKVRMLSRKVSIAIPNGVRKLSVERPWIKNEYNEALLCNVNSVNKTIFSDQNEALIPVEAGSVVSLTSLHPGQLDPYAISAPRAHPWAIVRRILAECRDRTYPLFKVLKKVKDIQYSSKIKY